MSISIDEPSDKSIFKYISHRNGVACMRACVQCHVGHIYDIPCLRLVTGPEIPSSGPTRNTALISLILERILSILLRLLETTLEPWKSGLLDNRFSRKV